MVTPNGPAARNDQRLQELDGVVKMGREANPDAEVSTLGDLLDLGGQEIARQIDDDIEGLNDV